MKGVRYVAALVLFLMAFMPVELVHAQTPAKKPLPLVPITYDGDTDKTIMRRAQWIEGAKKEGTLIWWGNLRPEEGNKIIAAFNKVYPYIKAEFVRKQSESVAATLEAEFAIGKASVDIVEGGGSQNLVHWRKMGMLEKFTDFIPTIGKRPKTTYGIYGDWAQARNNAAVPIYNTKLVPSPEAPKDWEDLLKPHWKGQIGMATDMRTWTVLAMAENGWGIEKTEEFLKQLKKQEPIWARGQTAGHQLMVSGEFKVMTDNFLYTVIESQKKGAPVDWVRVSLVPVTGAPVTLRKLAPHPNAARLFIEWVLSPEGLKAYEAAAQVGIIFPGAGTRQAKLLEGTTLCYRTEEMELKIIELKLAERFASILGVTPE